MNPAVVKNMVDAHKDKRKKEKDALAKAREKSKEAWDKYEESIRSATYV